MNPTVDPFHDVIAKDSLCTRPAVIGDALYLADRSSVVPYRGKALILKTAR